MSDIAETTTTRPKRWYIVHAYSNFEHRVKSALEERIERMGLQNYIQLQSSPAGD